MGNARSGSMKRLVCAVLVAGRLRAAHATEVDGPSESGAGPSTADLSTAPDSEPPRAPEDAAGAAPELDPLPDEVVVSVERRAPQTAGSTRATARSFRFVPRRTAEDLLELVPGLTLVQHGSEGKGHQFFLRGFDAIHGADLELTVQGIPINEWSNIHAQGYLDLGFVIPEVVASVEVTKGPFHIDQGAFAMAGSAAYSLALPYSELGARATLTLGTTQRRRALLTYSPAAGDGATFIAGELLHDDGFGQNRSIDRANLLGQIIVFESERLGTLRALGSFYAARFELPGALRSDDVEAGRIGFYDAYDPSAEGRSHRALVALAYSRERADLVLEATLYAGWRRLELLENITGRLLDPVFGDRRAQAQRTLNVGSDLDLGWRLLPSWRLEAGLGMRGDALEQHQDHVDASAAPLARERDLDGLQGLFFAKAGVRIEALTALHIRGGVRLDVARVAAVDRLAEASDAASGTLAAISPRLAIDAPVSEHLTWFAAYGRGFRPPEARAFSSFVPRASGIADDVYTGGEPAMTRTDSFELGARYDDIERAWGGGASAFATFIERESVYDHVSGVNLELNATRRLGVELELSSRPVHWLELRAFGTLVDARFAQSQNPVPLSPRQTAGFNIIAADELGPRAGLRGLLVGPRPLPHGARGSLLAVLDATCGWYWQRLRFDLELENLLDLRLREGEYHYASHFRADEPASEIPVSQFVAGPPFNARASATVLF
jgi:outer membrane receptor protein involved in Fe transport